MEEAGRLQSMGLQRVRHDWKTSLSLFIDNDKLEKVQITMTSQTPSSNSLANKTANDKTNVNCQSYSNFLPASSRSGVMWRKQGTQRGAGFRKPTREGLATRSVRDKIVPQGTRHPLVFTARACTLQKRTTTKKRPNIYGFKGRNVDTWYVRWVWRRWGGRRRWRRNISSKETTHLHVWKVASVSLSKQILKLDNDGVIRAHLLLPLFLLRH